MPRKLSVETFLRRRTFFCPSMCAWLRREECVDRQKRKATTKYYGRKIIVNNTPFDKWCRSKACKVGKRSKQIVKARKQRARVARLLSNVRPLRPAQRRRNRETPHRRPAPAAALPARAAAS
jgi:hypothetical protein